MKTDIKFKTKFFNFRYYRGYMSKKQYHPYANRLLTFSIFNKQFYFK